MIGILSKDLLFEIGIEEIPARFAAKAAEDLREKVREALAAARLGFIEISTYVTPRRLVLYTESLNEYQGSVERRVKGPSIKAAFDNEGKPSRAAEGFAKSQGVNVRDLVRLSDANGDYVYADVHEEGKRLDSVLPGILEGVLRGLSFPKNMRWGSNDFRFVRPIRWITLLWGEELIPMEFEGIKSGRTTFGHRTLSHSGPIELASAEVYCGRLRDAGVIVDQEIRKNMILDSVHRAAASISAEAVIDGELLEEINYIVEWPTAFIGEFKEEFLKIPEICITTPMQGYQRYFPVKREGRLLNRFIGVRNGGEFGLDNVKHGNERVLSARLADARFFFDEDMKKSLEQRKDLLEGITFAEGLGNMKEKSYRISVLAKSLIQSGDALGPVDEGEAALAEKAASISKCDLTTNMVREFTELQGEVGSIYARLEGYDEAVAQAISEHYLPKASGSVLPSSRIGACLAMADKADSLAGYFGLGKIPTGSADPFALRRSALGLIAIHESTKPEQGLNGLISKAVDLNWKDLPAADKAVLARSLGEFMEGRLKGLLLDEGHRYDLVDAAVQLGYDKPAIVRLSLGALEKDLGEGWMEELAEAFVRVRNIAKDATDNNFTMDLFSEEAEKLLATEYLSASAEIDLLLGRTSGVDEYARAMSRYSQLKPAIDRFFTDVMVNCDDQAIRKNRQGLVKSLEVLALRMADFSKVKTAKQQ